MTATYLSSRGATHAISFTDQLRPGAEVAVAELRRQGKAIKLVSGDTEAAVAALAGRLGISDWVAGALPAEKAAIVRGLSDSGRRVLMVGDGLNDTAALAAQAAEFCAQLVLGLLLGLHLAKGAQLGRKIFFLFLDESALLLCREPRVGPRGHVEFFLGRRDGYRLFLLHAAKLLENCADGGALLG
jgi:hypothetical protein